LLNAEASVLQAEKKMEQVKLIADEAEILLGTM